MLNDLSANKRDKFDHVLIETTGLANPAPIVQTFFLDEGLAANYRLDGIVTVVDCKHVMLRLDEVRAPSSFTPPLPVEAQAVAPARGTAAAWMYAIQLVHPSLSRCVSFSDSLTFEPHSRLHMFACRVLPRRLAETCNWAGPPCCG